MRLYRPSELLLKGKKMPIGTRSKGRVKVAEGKWVPIPKKGAKKAAPKKKAPRKSAPKKKKEVVESSSNAFYERAAQGHVTSKLFKKFNKADWNTKHGMMGHIFARRQVMFADHRLSKFMSDPKLKAIADEVLPFDSDDWHVLSDMTDSDIRTIAITLNRIRMGKYSPAVLAAYVSNHSPMLSIGPLADLERILECGAYIQGDPLLINRKKRAYTFYGMDDKEAVSRAKKGMEKTMEKYGALARKVWG